MIALLYRSSHDIITLLRSNNNQRGKNQEEIAWKRRFANAIEAREEGGGGGGAPNTALFFSRLSKIGQRSVKV